MVDLLHPGTPESLVLLSGRVSGLVLVAPVFSTKNVPTAVKSGLIILLTILLQPLAVSQIGAQVDITPASFLGEIVIGLVLGLGGALLIGAASVAGDLMGMQIGLSGAAVLDPINNSSDNVLGQFATLFAITLMLAVDAHLVMIDAVAHSLRLVPLGSALHAAGLREMVRSGGIVFALGIQFAAPVVAAILIANTALAVLSRAAPQQNILSVAFPIQIGVGLMALGASVPFIGAFYRGWTGVYGGMIDRLLASLARG